MEKIFTISPRFALDHYLEILSLINLKENFTIEDLKNYLLGEIRNSKNPLYRRMCKRAVAIINAVISELLNHGLLVRENQTFGKTGNLSEFYHMLKK